MTRLRLVAWRVQPIVMADDGETLTPLSVSAVDVPAIEWDTFKAGGDESALEQIRTQLEEA